MLVLGIFISTGVNIALAHGGNNNFIHACVGTGVLNNGRLRIIAANGTCNANETPLDWVQVPWNSDYPLMCQNCELTAATAGNIFAGKNLSNAVLISSWFDNQDFSNTNLSGASLRSTRFPYTNMHGVNLSNTQVIVDDFTGATLTDVNFTGSYILSSFVSIDLTGSNFTNAILNNTVVNSNLTGANMTNTSLSGVDMSTNNLNQVIWSNTICPDGTNSDNNGNTCEGHLIP
ncbi:hypothetical protein A2125_00410 [Candidatus Woesebacteria bacterium GWB1_43_5]|uniref:Pentapeptide repeat-containing protein n=1 Tax=Candidatus Woesebacteria bacterium GWB1_43_5 TaxID=1802474 RepID=A0A1F7WS29_9BACT|nr:MAG: hypothetical protein A2125_00410 [Candidatus Woesebacteria bacterium GWB1_43_5]